jgi:hypothetical protein
MFVHWDILQAVTIRVCKQIKTDGGRDARQMQGDIDRGKYRCTWNRCKKGTTEIRDRHKDKKGQRTDTVVERGTDTKKRDRWREKTGTYK